MCGLVVHAWVANWPDIAVRVATASVNKHLLMLGRHNSHSNLEHFPPITVHF